jgi:hypothetical protein
MDVSALTARAWSNASETVRRSDARGRARTRAYETLGELAVRVTREEAMDALVRLGERLARGVEACEEARASAARAMAKILETARASPEMSSISSMDARARDTIVRALGTCATDDCADVAIASLAAASAVARDRTDAVVVIKEIVAPCLTHRSGKVRQCALRALRETISTSDYDDVALHLTGGGYQSDHGERRVNYFGALACDRSPLVRMEFIRLCGTIINFRRDDQMARVLPYVLGALKDDIDDVRAVSEEVVRSSAENFEDLVCRHLGDVLLPAISELSAHASVGWREDIVQRVLNLLEATLSVAGERAIQFVPNLREGLQEVLAVETFDERTKRRALAVEKFVLSAHVQKFY